MKQLQFEYETKLEFSQSVTEHSFSLRCMPFSDGRQIIAEPGFEILPVSGSIWRSRDSFGNTLICGRNEKPHKSFSFRVYGKAQIVNSCKVNGSAPEFYKFHTPLTRPGKEIELFYKKNKPSGGSVLSRAEALSNSLFNFMTYKSGVTKVNTTAEQAIEIREGVCQDYAHILLSLLRIEGIRCRYVSGLAFKCGETHAWVEVYDGTCWTGIDATHNRLIGDNYIKLCHGRDYSDCPIERGIYRGNANSVQTVTSKVTEI